MADDDDDGRRRKLRRLKVWMGASFLAPLAAGPLVHAALTWLGER